MLSLLYEYPNAAGIGIDISEKAIEIAKFNGNILNIKNSDFLNICWNDLENTFNEKFDIIISNPPYIKSCDIPSLDENVKNYDPILSLDGGDDGLSAYREIIKIAKNILAKNGMLFLEIGYDQANDVMEILLINGFSDFEIIKDFNEIDRVIIAR